MQIKKEKGPQRQREGNFFFVFVLFFKKMRYLVTGCAGFIGSHFVQRVLDANKEDNLVVGVDCMYDCSAKKMAQSKDRYVFQQANINQQDTMFQLLVDYDIDIVVHFAAQSHVDTSFSTPETYIRDNVCGTFHLLQALRQINTTKTVPMIMISTDEVYGENTNHESHVETSLLKPSSVYAASKASAEMLCYAYHTANHVPIKTIRGNNCYGKQYPEKLIPRFIKLLQQNKPLTIQGDGSQRRSFVYVDDFCDAIFTVINNGINGHIYNIGSKDELSVLDVAQILKEEMKLDRELEFETVKDRDFNDKRYLIHSGELEQLGWKQKTNFRDGIREVIAFFESNEANDYWVKEYQLPTQDARVKRHKK